MPIRKGISTPAEFWAKVLKTESCWLWQGALNTYGYGQLLYDGKQKVAHRLAYELTHGPILSGLYVCHTCDVRDCANPAHVFLGTHQENMADMVAKGRAGSGRPKSGMCANGHPLPEDDKGLPYGGKRYCFDCAAKERTASVRARLSRARRTI